MTDAYSERFYLLPARCLGQIDPIVMGRAFLEGGNGLLLIGCHPEECHHSYGIEHTWSRIWVMKKLLDLCGIERELTRLAKGLADVQVAPANYRVTFKRSFFSLAVGGNRRK
jgi:coenzyme F420-reducing hydrogenase delta subunit